MISVEKVNKKETELFYCNVELHNTENRVAKFHAQSHALSKPFSRQKSNNTGECIMIMAEVANFEHT